jgi:hypothetical protein
MKNLAIIVALSSVASFAAVACGDSDSASTDKGGGGSGGASGSTATGGTSGSVTGGTAGTPATGGASGSATGGASGAATGGSTATGGMGGAGNEGGVGAEGGNGDGGVGAEGGGGPGPGPVCPANEPNVGANCSTRGLSCDFGDRTCRCSLNTGNWQCYDTNGDCPPMRDPNGNCTGAGTACSYGEAGTCICQQGNFNCDSGVAACPAMQPMDGASCTMFQAGTQCPYTAGDCTCQAGGIGRTWNCQNSACPAMTPTSTSRCQTPGLICEYTTPGPAADPTCVCSVNNRWMCL